MGKGGAATPELAFAHMLEFCRQVGANSAALKSGTPWETTVGTELGGKTLGLVGLGRLGQQMAQIAKGFGMHVIAWSQNLTPEKCAGTGADYAGREALFATADFVSVHLVLGDRSRGLIGAADFARMKPTAFFVNTSRGPIVEEAALIEALHSNRIAGAGLDVFDEEPLPLDHPLRREPRAQLTPHLGYVTDTVLEACYRDTVEAVAAFIAGKPIRLME
jgi:D-3-phosphoglycerate dehydrogenase